MRDACRCFVTLREKAYSFAVALSRRCSDLDTARTLEALGIELMEKREGIGERPDPNAAAGKR